MSRIVTILVATGLAVGIIQVPALNTPSRPAAPTGDPAPKLTMARVKAIDWDGLLVPGLAGAGAAAAGAAGVRLVRRTRPTPARRALADRGPREPVLAAWSAPHGRQSSASVWMSSL